MLAMLGWLLLATSSPAQTPSTYDVIWRTPSLDASGSMPLGNGDIGVNAWMSAEGALIFYLSKTDSWSENGRLLKVGRLRITADPPFEPSAAFEQRLNLATGTLEVHCGVEQDAATIRLWVDAHHPVIQVTVEGASERTVTAEIDLWRTERTAYPAAEVSDLLEDRSQANKLHEAVYVEPDTVMEGLSERIGWFHANQKSVGPKLIAELQGLTSFLAGKTDPLLRRIFGAVVYSPNGEVLDPTQLRSGLSKTHRFQVLVHTGHPQSMEQWWAATGRLSKEIESTSFEARRAAHENWWSEFWQRSWIDLTQISGSDPIPKNLHAVRIGVDQHGANRFVGQFGALRVATQADNPLVLFQTEQAAVGPIDDSANWVFAEGLRIDARIKAGDLPAGGGRIVDKTTPGRSDGFLFDTYPGRSLRLIVGSQIIQAKDVLPRDEWVEVTATVDAQNGALTLYLNGEEIASSATGYGHAGGDDSGLLGDADGLLNDAETVGRAYALQRWVDACAGRGRYPIKFNGSIFTVPHQGKFGDADYRRWGPGYWWQNTRLPYLSMCASGDTEMMLPLFRMYATELMELHKFRTRQYTGHDGAFIPECMYFWGPTFTATYGWTPYKDRGADKLQDSGYHKWEWVSGLELVWMMLDYVEHTGDVEFLAETLVPTAHEILTFFEQHSPLDENGKLVMTPSQALETWWDCTNPMPEVAGLRAVTSRLLAMSIPGFEQEREFWQQVLEHTPELPTWEKDGERLLAPAERFEAKSNVENPELYAVFPFRLVSFEKDNAELGLRALENRWDRGASGWRQDDLFMTHLGLAEAARANLVSRARNKHTGSRFPAFWGPNYDWIPDQDHGGVLMRTLQTMLMQTEGKKIFLLPAWPKEWDADFKLHAPYQTTVSGKVQQGKIIDLKVVPESRRKDIILP
jgi:uncharacterized protein DUF5703/concanavalin A-like lectin/glucanase superfamily protein